MGIFNQKQKANGFMDEIRCDESSYLIWKWHPNGMQPGNNNRENAIRWGSSLRVKDGEVAVFVYNQKNGPMEDFIVGPFDQIIKTANFPVLASIVGLAYDGGTPFQAEIYFINLAQIIQCKFAVPFFDVYDPRFMDFGVPIAVRGTVTFKISDYKEFVKLHRLQNFNIDEFEKQIRDAVSRYVKDVIANAPSKNNIPVIQLETQIAQVNTVIENDLKKRLFENFGVDVSGIDIGAIEIDKSSDGYYQLMAVTKDITMAKVKAETADYIERLKIQREEGQYAQHKQTQNSNLGAFQIEKQTEIGVAGAEALGHMGENGAGNIDLNGNNSGFNPASIMAEMSLGAAIGQNMADVMKNSISGVNSTDTNKETPPPIPSSSYYIAINGQAAGPYDINHIKNLAVSGQFSSDTLVWKSGMKEWIKAEEIDELKNICMDIPPIPPKE